MREIRTFILRLLVDSDEPEALRGVLRPVDGDEERPFADQRALLTLLHQGCQPPAPADDAPSDGAEAGPPTNH